MKRGERVPSNRRRHLAGQMKATVRRNRRGSQHAATARGLTAKPIRLTSSILENADGRRLKLLGDACVMNRSAVNDARNTEQAAVPTRKVSLGYMALSPQGRYRPHDGAR